MNKKYFYLLYDKWPQPYQLLSIDGSFIAVNEKWHKKFGYCEQDILNKNFIDIVHKESRANIHKALSDAKRTGSINQKEFQLLKKDNNIVDLFINGAVVTDESNNTKYILLSLSDNTKIKKLETQLHLSKTQFDLFMKNIPAIVTIKDDNNKLIYANEHARNFFNNIKIVGKDAYELLPKKQADILYNLNEKAREVGSAEAYVELTDEKGGYLHFRVLTFAVKQNNNKIFTGSVYLDITDKYQDQYEITKLKTAVENIPISILITDIAGRIEYINPWFTQLTGYNEDEILGENPRILQSGHTPKKVYKELWGTITEGGVWSGIFKNRKKNSQEYSEAAIISPVINKDGKITNYIGIKQEITEKAYLQQELIRQGKKSLELGAILENIISEIYIFSKKNHKFLYANKQARQNIGYSSKDLYKLTPIDIKPDITSDELNKKLAMLENPETKKIFFETYHQRKDGTKYPVDIYIHEVTFDDQKAYMAIILDISERKKIEDKLRAQEEIMIAQSRHAAMGEMIGMIAHQWRQPLTSIVMSANNLLVNAELNNIQNDNQNRYIDSILEQTKYLSETIDDFKNFFRPDREMERVEVKKVLNEAIKIIGKSLEYNAVNINVNCDSETEIKTYSRELLQVFINLIKNAEEALIKNIDKNREIKITVNENKTHIIVTVCDNAGGIEDKIKDKIFNPYFSTKKKKNGTGLGLYMSKTIIEKHLQGTIKTYNKDKGACFKILLSK